MEESFIKDRIETTQKAIVAFEDAILAITTGAIDSYTLDTGQSRTVVTKLNISTLVKAKEASYTSLRDLERLLTGGGGMVVPAW